MLFDLRGRGRRRSIQAIYLSLALLMGGGLVLFGIGSNTGEGGILDAVVGEGGSSSATEQIDKRIKTQVAKTRANTRDEAAWAELARLRFQRAGIDGLAADDTTYTDKGKQTLGLAAQAWERHVALDPKQPNVRVARIMVQAYGTSGLNQLPKAVQALQLVTAAEKPPSWQLYGQLAQLAYQASDTRTGDLAADRAIELAPDAQKKLLRTELARIKTEATTGAQPTATTATG